MRWFALKWAVPPCLNRAVLCVSCSFLASLKSRQSSALSAGALASADATSVADSCGRRQVAGLGVEVEGRGTRAAAGAMESALAAQPVWQCAWSPLKCVPQSDRTHPRRPHQRGSRSSSHRCKGQHSASASQHHCRCQEENLQQSVRSQKYQADKAHYLKYPVSGYGELGSKRAGGTGPETTRCRDRKQASRGQGGAGTNHFRLLLCCLSLIFDDCARFMAAPRAAHRAQFASKRGAWRGRRKIKACTLTRLACIDCMRAARTPDLRPRLCRRARSLYSVPRSSW